MGMFDYIKCEVPLPDGFEPKEAFQTKDFDCLMDTFTIKADGSLEQTGFRLWRSIDGPTLKIRLHDFHGIFVFYGYDDEKKWREYKAKFTDGKLASITVVEDDVS